jgi:hypothetical protein
MKQHRASSETDAAAFPCLSVFHGNQNRAAVTAAAASLFFES